MEKIVKNWELEVKLGKLDRTSQIISYLLSIDNWGVRWYDLGDWVELVGRCYWDSDFGVVGELWVLNNRMVRCDIGEFWEGDFVSGVCLIGEEVL
jgi:hypothetical protein